MKVRVALSILVTVVWLASLAWSGAAAESPTGPPNSPRAALEESREVILAAQHNRSPNNLRLYAFDPDTLEPLGSFALSGVPYTITPSADGRRLLVAEIPEGEVGCCTLSAYDLASGARTRLVAPAGRALATPDGKYVVAQRGNCGVELLDAETLALLPTIDAPGLYSFDSSPDGRWLFGTTNSQRGFGPSLDVIDLHAKRLHRRLPLPSGLSGQGAWLDGKYYLYAYDGRQGHLWEVGPETASLGTPTRVPLPDQKGGDAFILHIPVAAGGRLIVYERFGYKLDRRYRQGDSVTGGAYAIDPSSGEVIAHYAPSAHFGRLMASGDGRWLYGLDTGKLQWRGPVRLLKLDAASGEVVAERALDTDSWSMTVARLDRRLVPGHGRRTAPVGE